MRKSRLVDVAKAKEVEKSTRCQFTRKAFSVLKCVLYSGEIGTSSEEAKIWSIGYFQKKNLRTV